MLQLNDNTTVAQNVGLGTGAGMAGSLASMLQSVGSSVPTSTGNSSAVTFVDAFKELLSRAGQFGIHFIISLDNPDTIRIIKSELYSFTYKVFTKGISSTVISEAIGEMKNNAINNPEIALVAIQGEKYKVRMYRYDDMVDNKWYKELVSKYLDLR